VVNYDDDMSLKDKASEAGFTLHSWKEMNAAGEKSQAKLDIVPKCSYDYILSYTSGTTGDSKGVKLTHANILSVVETCKSRITVNEESKMISYLPYPHSFE